MWLLFELICAVYLEYIVNINFVQPYQNILTLHVQYIKNKAVKKCLPYKLICATYIEYIVINNFVQPYLNLLTLYVQSLRTKLSKSGFYLSLYVQYT